MTGSVRGALSNERPYRDRAHVLNDLCEPDLARRAHAGNGGHGAQTSFESRAIQSAGTRP